MTPVTTLRRLPAARLISARLISAPLISVCALSALAGCVVGPQANREFEPAAPVMEAAPAAPAPVEVATLDPLNAPPPAAAPAAEGMLVPAPEGNSSQRVPLNSLPQAAPPAATAAPTSLLTPPGTPVQLPPASNQMAPAQMSPAQMSPAQMAPAQAAPPMQVAQAAQMAPEQPAKRETELAAGQIRPTIPPQPAAAPVIAQTVPSAAPVAPASPPLRLRAPEGVAPAAPAPSEDATVVISSATTRTMQPREFVPASLTPPPTIANPGPGEIPLSAAEKSAVQRFEILKRLEDEALITHEEYMKRRAANAGALLPYTQRPPAEGLGRPVPSADAIVARLAALRRSFEMRAITPQQHALERNMILNALLPENPEDRADPKPPPRDMIEGAAEAGHLERLREKNLISAEELQAEKDAIEHAVATGLLPSQEPARTGAARRAAAAPGRPAGAPPAAKAAAAPVSPLDREITGPVVHIASYRTEASALKGWDEVIAKNKALLGGMQPIVRKVDLGEQGIFYRLMAGSYASLGEAEAACIKLKEAGQFCRASATGG